MLQATMSIEMGLDLAFGAKATVKQNEAIALTIAAYLHTIERLLSCKPGSSSKG